MVNRPGKNSEKLQRGVVYTSLSPLVRSMLYEIAFPMNGFFIGRNFICVKKQNFCIKKNICLQMYIFLKIQSFYSYLAV